MDKIIPDEATSVSHLELMKKFDDGSMFDFGDMLKFGGGLGGKKKKYKRSKTSAYPMFQDEDDILEE